MSDKKNDEKYEDLVPYSEIVEKIRNLKNRGFKIVFYTSRNMKTYKGDISKILLYTKPTLEKWLDKWNVPYDDIVYGKPWPGVEGYYVDDRTIRPKEFLNLDISEMEIITKEGRIE